MMKKLLASILAVVTLVLMSFAIAGCDTQEEPQQADYTVVRFLETEDGAYEEFDRIVHKGTVGATVTYTPETLNGYEFDGGNTQNVLSAEVKGDGSTQLRAYYKRTQTGPDDPDNPDNPPATQASYTVVRYTEGDSGFTEYDRKTLTGTVGATVTYTPEPIDGYVFDGSNGNNLLSDTLRAEGTVLSAYYKKAAAFVLEQEIVKAYSSVKADITVADETARYGLVYLYNTPASDSSISEESYLWFFAEGNKVKLVLVTGEEEQELGSATILPAAEVREFAISRDESGVHCSLDGEALIDYAADLTVGSLGGLVGARSSGAGIAADVEVEEGAMTLEEAKEYAIKAMTVMPLEHYTVQSNGLFAKQTDEFDAHDYDALAEFVTAAEEAVASASAPVEVWTALNAYDYAEARRCLAKEVVFDTLHQAICDFTDITLMPYIDNTEDPIPNGDLTSMTIDPDVDWHDTRWYCPNAFMLYSKLEGARNRGLFDYLREDLAFTESVEDALEVGEAYVFDLVRAACYKNAECYYWYQYNLRKGATVAGVTTDVMESYWQYLWNYTSAMGSLKYRGVLEQYDYDWPTGEGSNLQFRLLAAWFNPDDPDFDEYFQDVNGIITSYVWFRDRQSVRNAQYIVIRYTETARGVYTEYDRSEPVTVKAGTLVTYEPEEIEGYTFNEDYEKNQLSVTPLYNSAETPAEIHVYYSPTTPFPADIQYTVIRYVEGDSGFTEHDRLTRSGTAGTVVTYDPEAIEGYVFDRDNEQNKLSDTLTEGLELKAYYKKETAFVLAPELFAPAKSTLSASIDVKDGSRYGLVYLYNTAASQNLQTADVTYLWFYVEGTKAVLSRYVGETETVLAEGTTEIGNGTHTFAVTQNETEIVCSLDGTQAVTYTIGAESPEVGYYGGRVGVKTSGANISYSALTLGEGGMSVEDLKTYALELLTSVRFPYYHLSPTTKLVEKPVGLFKAEDYEMEEDVQKATAALTGRDTVSAIWEAINSYDRGDLNDRLAKAAVWETLHTLMSDFVQIHLIAITGPINDPVPMAQAKSITLTTDIYEKDKRWWCPNAFMLYSGLGSGHTMGLFDYLQQDMNAVSTYAEYISLGDEYVYDLVRAVVYKCAEMFYSLKYNELGTEGVISVYTYLYTFSGTNELNYKGVLEKHDFQWGPPLQYRLMGALFNPEKNSNYYQNINETINAYAWYRDHQVVKAPAGAPAEPVQAAALPEGKRVY